MRAHSVKSKQTAAKENWLNRGAALMQAKQYAEASAGYSESILKLPTDAQLFY
jgi:hypothetical protein